MNSVLDSSAMIAYLGGEPGAEVVEGFLLDSAAVCYAHSVSLCEVYYHYVRAHDVPTARKMIDALLADGVRERSDMDRDFWERVGDHKARGRIALGDCFCLALAEMLQAQVVTSDHREFDPLVARGICPIHFIR